MPKTSKSQSTKKRVKVGKLPSKAKKLAGKDAKRVKGGIIAVLKQTPEKW